MINDIKIKYFNLNNTLNIFIYIFLFTFISTLILPINPNMPSQGLDPSWKYVIDYVFSNNLQFGKDIYFTFGPLSDFWFPTYFYNESTYNSALVLSFLFILTIFCSLFQISKNSTLLIKIIGFLSIIVGFIIGGNFLWYILPILFIQIVFLDTENKKLKFMLSIVLVFFLSFSILVKFSHFPTAIISVLTVDIYFYLKNKNKNPLYTIILFIFMIVLFIISGQDIVNFPAFFIGSFHTLSGYSESMQVFTSNKIIYIFLILSILMLTILIKTIIKSNDIKTYIFIFISVLVLFMAFKNGFVRQDGHSVAAYSGLSFVFGLLLIYFSKDFIHQKYRLYFIYFLCLISICMSYMVKTYYTGDRWEFKRFDKSLWNDMLEIKNNFISIPNLLKKSRIQELNSEYNLSVENIKKQIDLSDMKGSVDIYPWDQSFVIAYGLDYRPRPLFQSYSVYTPYLIEKNIEFLKSNRAPDNILFSIKEIDGRAPFMMEGASWLEIMKRYDVVDLKGEFLVLKKSSEQKDYNLEKFEPINVKFGDEIKVPNEKQIYVNIDIQKSFFGKITNILFKTPIVWIELTFENGNKERFRIVPGISSSGFILSPSIKSIGDFFNFSIGNDLNQNKIKSFKILNDSKYCYKNDLKILFNKINIKNFKISDKVSSKLEKMNFYDKIISLNENLKAPFFQVENYKNEQIIFSHVGTSFKVSGKLLENFFNNSKKVEVKYSIKEEAYTNGANNEGACFNIYEENKLIKNHCINPRDLKSDRDLKSFIFDNIDSDKNYMFEISMIEGKSSSYGWTFWQF